MSNDNNIDNNIVEETTTQKVNKVKRKSHKKPDKKVVLLRVCIGVLSAILLIILIVTVTFLILRTSGKNSIYNNGGDSIPVIDLNDDPEQPSTGTDKPDISWDDPKPDNTEPSSEGSSNTAETESQSNAQETQGNNNGYVYQAGDISYNGHVYRYNSDIMTFLVMGIDSVTEIPEDDENIDYIKGNQADANFLFVMNPHTKQLTCIAISRNTITDIDVYDSDNNYVKTVKAQLCLQHGFGDGKAISCERHKQAVSKLFYNLPIHGYVSIRLNAIPAINDSVGGVEVTPTEDFEPLGLKAGVTVRLDGDQAYTFMQYRDRSVFDSATNRLNREKLYLNSFMSAALQKVKSDITFPVTMYTTLSKYVYTDLSIDEITYLASELVGYSFDNFDIRSVQGEVIKGSEFEEFYIDKQALRELMLQVFYEVVN